MIITRNMKNWKKDTPNLSHLNRLLAFRTNQHQGGLTITTALLPNTYTPQHLVEQNQLWVWNRTANHLLYMNDLMTFGKDDNKQTGLLTICKVFSDDIKMEFGLDKCAKPPSREICWQKTTIELDTNKVIREIKQEGT